MAGRARKADAELAVERLNARIRGLGFDLDGAYGGWRLTSHGGSRDVSSRLPLSEMIRYLNAMHDALDLFAATITEPQEVWLEHMAKREEPGLKTVHGISLARTVRALKGDWHPMMEEPDAQM